MVCAKAHLFSRNATPCLLHPLDSPIIDAQASRIVWVVELGEYAIKDIFVNIVNVLVTKQ
jgi:hypothetical protein